MTTNLGPARYRTTIDLELTPEALHAVADVEEGLPGALAQFLGPICRDAIVGAGVAKGVDLEALDGAELTYATSVEFGAVTTGEPATPPDLGPADPPPAG